MVYVISGKRNQGKTTKLKEIFTSLEDAHGFVAEKVSDCGRITSFVLTDLRNGDRCMLGVLASLPKPEPWGDELLQGPYAFSSLGFQWALDHFEKALKQGAKTYMVDELGRIELQEKGHAELIRRVLDAGLDLYVTVRDSNVASAVKRFGFDHCTVIDVPNRGETFQPSQGSGGQVLPEPFRPLP